MIPLHPRGEKPLGERIDLRIGRRILAIPVLQHHHVEHRGRPLDQEPLFPGIVNHGEPQDVPPVEYSFGHAEHREEASEYANEAEALLGMAFHVFSVDFLQLLVQLFGGGIVVLFVLLEVRLNGSIEFLWDMTGRRFAVVGIDSLGQIF